MFYPGLCLEIQEEAEIPGAPQELTVWKANFYLLAVTQRKKRGYVQPLPRQVITRSQRERVVLGGKYGLPRVGLFNLKQTMEALNIRFYLFSLYWKDKCSFARPMKNKR